MECIPDLVRSLGSKNSSVQRTAARELAELLVEGASSTACMQDAVRAAGGIPALVRLLSVGKTTVQAQAAGALADLAYYCPANSACMLEAGAIPALVRLLEQGPAAQNLLRAAAIALNNIAVTGEQEQVSPAIEEAGGVRTLLRCLDRSRSSDVQAALAGALGAAANGYLPVTRAVADAGGVAILLRLYMDGDSSSEVKAAAATALAFIAVQHSVKHDIIECGAIPALLQGVRSSSSRLQLAELKVLAIVSYGCRRGEEAVAAAGAIPALEPLVQHPSCSQDVSRLAAAVIHNAALCTRDKRCVVCAHGAPPGQKMKRCSRCMELFYCGVACQREHWPHHRTYCKAPEPED